MPRLIKALPRPDEDDPSAAAAKRNQTTAVILCGVIGSLFDLEQEKVCLLESLEDYRTGRSLSFQKILGIIEKEKVCLVERNVS